MFLENHWSVKSTDAIPAQFRIVHWNVQGHLARSGAQNVLLEHRANLYVLSEIPGAASVEALCIALGPEFKALVFGNLAVIGDRSVRADGWLINRNRSRVQKVTYLSPNRNIVLLIVDLPSSVFVHREPLLRQVNEMIAEHQPDLVIGDFNAPRRSRALCELPAGYHHAYDTSGAGVSYTWPVPLPMYSLDHCIHSADVSPARYKLCPSWHSDHKLQVFDFAWKHK